ncbi:50S ribosomal protein L23 [Patescibacteria group bacterium]|nr:50S ribosomal protein L23 [Patescibacteria group bacterium]
MGFLNKILKKSAKSSKQAERTKPDLKKQRKEEKKAVSPKEEPTIAELKDQETEAEKGEQKKVVKKVEKKDDTKDAYRILSRPMITEKGTYLAGQNKYIFEVATNANKIEIKKAIKAVYGVEPIAINIINLPGKRVQYRRIRGRTKRRKKAIVTLPEGQTIEVYEGV